MVGSGGRGRPRLTRAAILAAALNLVDRDGAAALTMRRLGEELGVEAMSLPNHVANRDALLEGLGELLMADVGPAAGTDWARACRTFARRLRATTVRHPAAFQLIGLRPLRSPATLAPVERLVGCLVAAGATPAAALVIHRVLASYARGYALAEVSGFTVDATTAAARRPLAALDAAAFPILRGTIDELGAVTPHDAFESGLDALLDGFGVAYFAPAG